MPGQNETRWDGLATPILPAEFEQWGEGISQAVDRTPPVVPEVNGVYQVPDNIAEIPHATWLGESSPASHPDFKPWNPATGEGHTWQEVPST